MKIKNVTKKQCKTNLKQINQSRQTLNSIMPFCRGSIHKVYKTCGKPGCSCQKDESKKHGPYYSWIMTKDGKKIQRTLRLDQVEFIKTGIARYRAFQKWRKKFEENMEEAYLSDNEWQMTALSKKKTKDRKKK